MRYRSPRSMSSIFTLSFCGQGSGFPLSTLNESVAGLHLPPGEIRVGGSDQLGATPIVPRSDCELRTGHDDNKIAMFLIAEYTFVPLI